MNTSPLKAMFWKECRENARWAALSAAALSLGLAYAWFHLFQQSSWPSFSNVWSSENLVLTITTPLVALALGLLQVLPELRRDQWAFLVHRPASRTTLFFGKALAGVCLYLLATVLPLLGLAAWASSPGHVPAPFDFRFTLAGWASVLAGLPFYFAGLLVALRPARWYGSRALPLLTTLLAPLAAAQFIEFLPVVLCCLLVAAILLYAAWGSFVSGGEYTEQAKPARFALGLTLYPAVLVVGVGALMLPVVAYNLLSGKSGGSREMWRNDQKIDTQGRVYEMSEHTDDKGHTTKSVTDLSGRPIDPRLWQNLNQQHKLLDFAYLPESGSSTEYYHYSQADRYVISLTSTISDANQNYWYYEMGARQIVGYSVTADGAVLAGYLGPNGFAKEQDQAGRFTGPRPEPNGFAGLHLLRFPQALYWYDTSALAIKLLQATPGGSGGTTLLGANNDAGQEEAKVLIIAAGGQITAYTRAAAGPPQAPSRLFTVPVAFAPSTYSNIQVAMTPDQSSFFFWYGATPAGNANRFVVVSSTGRVVRLETLPLAKIAAASWKPQFMEAVPALIVPPAFTATMAVYAAIGHALKDETGESWWRGFANGGLLFSALFFSVLGGFIAVLPAWLISRRLGDGRRGQIAWALGGFLLGGYGVLLLLALRAWPARVPCPNCGRQRVVDNEACEHCGALFARPKRDGTEIFDADGREMAAR